MKKIRHDKFILTDFTDNSKTGKMKSVTAKQRIKETQSINF